MESVLFSFVLSVESEPAVLGRRWMTEECDLLLGRDGESSIDGMTLH